MNMTRRSFFGFLTGGVAAAATVPAQVAAKETTVPTEKKKSEDGVRDTTLYNQVFS
jgi:hypothetical protein